MILKYQTFYNSDHKKFTNEIIKNKIKKKLLKKSEISGFIDNVDLDKKIATLAINAELKSKQVKSIKNSRVLFKLFLW